MAKNGDDEKEVQDIIDIFLQLLRDRSLSFHLTLDHIKAVLMVTSLFNLLFLFIDCFGYS